MVETHTAILPEHVASYAMYGEPGGDDSLESAYDAWLQREMEYHGFTSIHLVDVSENQGFMRYHELHDFGIGSCDTETFTYHVTK